MWSVDAAEDVARPMYAHNHAIAKAIMLGMLSTNAFAEQISV